VKRLVDTLAAGARVFVSTLGNESALLAEELRQDPERARGVTFAGVQFPGIDRLDYLSLHPQARQTSFFMTPSAASRHRPKAAPSCSPSTTPASRAGSLIETRFDAAIAQLTPPDAAWLVRCRRHCRLHAARLAARAPPGRPSQPAAAAPARVVPGPHVGDRRRRRERRSPCSPMPSPSPAPVESAIADHVSALVRDGDTLQFGIGAVPSAVASALASHRRLRLHGGLVATSLRTLSDSGALDADARITTGVVLGDADLHAFVHELPRLWLTDVPRDARRHHDRRCDRRTRVSSPSTARSRSTCSARSTPSGRAAPFRPARAACQRSPTLPATRPAAGSSSASAQRQRAARASRIVASLGDGALCTLPRHLADAFVTEHGAAEVAGLDIDRRAEALIAIAAPAHRAALAADWQRIRAAL
jgi:hypothetical protein